jgi:signal transduction histidine kinase
MWQQARARQDGAERQMDEERRRVSARLHSSITQSLAALTANLDLIAGSGQHLTPARRRLLVETRALARDCFQQVRALADELHPPLIAEVGLCRALAALVAGFVERTHMPVACDPRECPRLPEDVETAMYRLVEECLNDLRPPLGAGAASVVLRPTRRTVRADDLARDPRRRHPLAPSSQRPLRGPHRGASPKRAKRISHSS